MKDKHTINLILISSRWFNSFLPEIVHDEVILGSKCFHLFVSGVQSFLGCIVAKLHLNHRKASPCVFNFSFFLSSFYNRSSSWWFVKHSLSCIPKCNSFYLIFCGGVMSLLTISFMVHDSYCCQEWGILNQSISSLELCWVIFPLKLSLKIVAIYGAHKWPRLIIYLPGRISFSSPCGYQSNLLFL